MKSSILAAKLVTKIGYQRLLSAANSRKPYSTSVSLGMKQKSLQLIEDSGRTLAAKCAQVDLRTLLAVTVMYLSTYKISCISFSEGW